MRILTVGDQWQGGITSFFIKAFTECGHEVQLVSAPNAADWARKTVLSSRLLGIARIEEYVINDLWQKFNRHVRDRASVLHPDIFFAVNESYLFPETLSFLKRDLSTTLICWVADNPFGWRFRCFPANLPLYTHIFVAEPIWIPHIQMVAKPAVLEVLHCAAAIDIFQPVEVSEDVRKRFNSPISFVGSSYSTRHRGIVEGFYRCAILESVADLGLKLWGDVGWQHYFSYYPKLRRCWQGRGTSLEETNILNQASDIVLNISNPQLFSAPQLRTFEIPASGGFQIADRLSEIDKLFPGKEIVQFSSFGELKEKITYYLSHPDERKDLAERARKLVLEKHTFRHRVETMLQCIK